MSFYIVEVSRIFLHPSYNPEQRLANNIAVVHVHKLFIYNQILILRTSFQTRYAFRIELLLPRHRSGMTTNTTYQLFGWGGMIPVNNLFPPFIDVQVFGPQFCNPNDPPNFCSVFNHLNDAACRAPFEGSPVLWNFALVGFLLNDQGCAIHGDQFSLTFQNVAVFAEWIEGVSAAEQIKMSAIVILSAVLISFRNFIWIINAMSW